MLEHLAELAVLTHDSAGLTRAASRYLAADSSGDDASFIRWMVAASGRDEAGLKAARKAFPQLSQITLRRLAGASQLIPLDLETGTAAGEEMVRRAVEQGELYTARKGVREFLLNRGRPSQADRAGPGPTDDAPFKVSFEPFLRVVQAVYWDGDSAVAARAVAARIAGVRKAATHLDSTAAGPMYDVCAVALWEFRHDSLARMDDWIRTLNAFPRPFETGRAFIPLCAATLEAGLAHRQNRSTATRAVERLDSLMQLDWTTNGHTNLAATMTLAELFSARGDDARALAAVRRRSYIQGSVGITGLSTLLLAEGRLALRLADTTGAIRAFDHYLTLRADPEARLRPIADSVRAVVAELKRQRH